MTDLTYLYKLVEALESLAYENPTLWDAVRALNNLILSIQAEVK